MILMTAQIGDQYKFKNSEYTIVARSAAMDFHPSEYGIMPEAACTACWSGFWCVYNVTDGGIFLEDLYVNAKDDYYPPIEGVLPEQQNGNETFTYMGHHRYAGLNIRIPYTGKILVGDKFMHEYQYSMRHCRTNDFKESINAFLEKRKPVYTGK